MYEQLGKAAGAGLGFIHMNVPGAILGYKYGGIAGKYRDNLSQKK